MKACVVLLRVSYRMFCKQRQSGQHCTVRIIDTATLIEAFVVLLRDRDVLKYVYWTLFCRGVDSKQGKLNALALFKAVEKFSYPHQTMNVQNSSFYLYGFAKNTTAWPKIYVFSYRKELALLRKELALLLHLGR